MLQRIGIVGSIMGLLVLAPVTVRQDSGVQWNKACAAGQGCCYHVMAICEIGGQPYNQYENKSWIQIIFGCGN